MISPNAAATSNNRVYFMDRNGFYVYSGSTERVPCTVLDYVLSDTMSKFGVEVELKTHDLPESKKKKRELKLEEFK